MTISDLIRNKIVEMLDSVGGSSTYKVLVVDADGLRILNSVMTLTEVTDKGVLCVEGLTTRRKPYPNRPAIYFFGPHPQSIQQLIDDFSTGHKPIPYECVHAYCTTTLTDTVFDRIKTSPVVKHLRALKELNVDFVAPDSNCFITEIPDALRTCYNPGSDSLKQYGMKKIARKLSGVLESFEEIPYIRYYGADDSSPAEFARILSEESKEYISEKKDINPEERSTLLILGRDFDMLSPFMHEFTYHAIITDLLGIEDGKFKIENDSKEVSKLDDRDKLWMETKYWHIAEVMEHVSSLVSELTQSKAAQYSQNEIKSNDIQSIKDVVQDLPEFTKKKELLGKHTTLCKLAMQIYEHFNLELVSNMEQDLAVGETISGKPCNSTVEEIGALLGNGRINHEDKVRLLLIYIISKDGIPDSDRQHLIEIAGLSMDEAQAIHNLSMLNVRLSESFLGKTGRVYGMHCRGVDYKYDNFRWLPTLISILRIYHQENRDLLSLAANGEDIRDTLNNSKFPYVGDKRPPPPNVEAVKRPVKAQWAIKKGNESISNRVSNTKYPKLIVYILGGITLSEVRVCDILNKELSTEIVAGSTNLLRPVSFLTNVSELHLVGRAARQATTTTTNDAAKHPTVVLSDISKKLEKYIASHREPEIETQFKELELDSSSGRSPSRGHRSTRNQTHRAEAGQPQSDQDRRRERNRRWAERRDRGDRGDRGGRDESRGTSPTRDRTRDREYPPSPRRAQAERSTRPSRSDNPGDITDRDRDRDRLKARLNTVTSRSNTEASGSGSSRRTGSPTRPYDRERGYDRERAYERDRNVGKDRGYEREPDRGAERIHERERVREPRDRDFDRERDRQPSRPTIRASSRERGSSRYTDDRDRRIDSPRSNTERRMRPSASTPANQNSSNLRYFESDDPRGMSPRQNTIPTEPNDETKAALLKEKDMAERLGLRRMFTKKK